MTGDIGRDVWTVGDFFGMGDPTFYLMPGRKTATGLILNSTRAGFSLTGIRNIASVIANGHASTKHLHEFAGMGVNTKHQLENVVQEVMRNASGSNVRNLGRGRTAFWDGGLGTVVIHDPNSPDLGTVFRPANGRAYFDSLR